MLKDSILETETAIYQCYDYHPLFGTVTREYKAGPNPDCSGHPYSERIFYEDNADDNSHRMGDLYQSIEHTGTLSGSTEILLVTTYSNYDDLGNAQQVVDANGVVTDYIYDRLGRVIEKIEDAVIGGGNFTTTYQYLGPYLARVQNPSGSVDRYVYDDGKDVAYIRPYYQLHWGSTTAEKNTDPRNPTRQGYFTERIIYNIDFDYTNHTKTNSTIYQYMPNISTSPQTSRFTSVQEGYTVFSYSGDTAKYRYTITREGSTTDPTATKVMQVFDFSGNIIARINGLDGPDEVTQLFVYDKLGRLDYSFYAGDPYVNYYHYDLHGNLSRVFIDIDIDQNYYYYYDDFGRLIAASNPDAGNTYYQYDARGNLVAKTDSRGITVQYEYDNLDRLTKIINPNDADVAYYYDNQGFKDDTPEQNGMGRLSSVEIMDGATERDARYFVYGYDRRGHQNYEGMFLWGVFYSTRYTYDADGNLSMMMYPDGRDVHYLPQTSSDTNTPMLNNPDKVGEVQARVLALNSLVKNVQYEPFGGIKHMEFGNKMIHDVSRDHRGAVTEIKVGATGQSALMHRDYVYDSRGNITAIADPVNPAFNQSFGYHNASQVNIHDYLTHAQGAYGVYDWNYDGAGNRTSESSGAGLRTYQNVGNELRAVSGPGYSSNMNYDAAGSMTDVFTQEGATAKTLSASYNDGMRLSNVLGSAVSPAMDYVYDHQGRRVLKVDNSTGAGTVYFYDQAGNMIGEAVAGVSSGTARFLHDWVYLGSDRIAMLNEFIPLPGFPGFPGCQRTMRAQSRMRQAQSSEMGRVAALNWSAGLLLPIFGVALLRIRRKRGILLLIGISAGVATIMLVNSHSTDAATPQQPFYYHNDHLGTPQFVTDRTGAIVWEGHYKPFGEVFSNNGISNVYQPFRFPGQYEDPETGWYYNWNRYYIATIGKYSILDPHYRLWNGNNYYFTKNNPLILCDISGLACCDCKQLADFASKARQYKKDAENGVSPQGSTGMPSKETTTCENKNPTSQPSNINFDGPETSEDCVCAITHEYVHRTQCRDGKWHYNEPDKTMMDAAAYNAQLGCIKNRGASLDCPGWKGW